MTATDRDRPAQLLRRAARDQMRGERAARQHVEQQQAERRAAGDRRPRVGLRPRPRPRARTTRKRDRSAWREGGGGTASGYYQAFRPAMTPRKRAESARDSAPSPRASGQAARRAARSPSLGRRLGQRARELPAGVKQARHHRPQRALGHLGDRRVRLALQVAQAQRLAVRFGQLTHRAADDDGGLGAREDALGRLGQRRLAGVVMMLVGRRRPDSGTLPRRRSRSSAALTAMRCSQVVNAARPSKRPRLRQTLIIASWTASSASSASFSTRIASESSFGRASASNRSSAAPAPVWAAATSSPMSGAGAAACESAPAGWGVFAWRGRLVWRVGGIVKPPTGGYCNQKAGAVWRAPRSAGAATIAANGRGRARGRGNPGRASRRRRAPSRSRNPRAAAGRSVPSFRPFAAG